MLSVRIFMRHALSDASARLTKRFAVIGGVVIIAASIALAILHRQIAGGDLEDMAERNNVALTRTFSNVLWPHYADFLRSAHELDVESLRSHPKTKQLRQDVLSLMRGLSVVKVKIYDLDGLTVFSTDAGQIGEDKSQNNGFLSARIGHVVSELTHRDTFSAFEQVVEDRDVLSSYVPIGALSGDIEGVFEIYYDVTELLHTIEHSQYLQIVIVGSTFLVLYLLLIGVVWRSARQSQKGHEENLRLARAAAVAEEASRLKSDFLAHMSHELRTPLNAVIGFSEALTREIFGPVGSAKYTEYAGDIVASGRHLLAIIDDVLDMAKIEAGQVRLEEVEFDPVAAVRACVRLVEGQALEAGVRLTTEAPREPLRLCGDERRVKQIVLNLLSNAVKFTRPGGTVTTAICRTAAGGLNLVVADTGVGIAAQDLETVLTPFGRTGAPYSGTSSGTGLGLPIAKSFAALHGASFDLSSELGRGTRVRVEFPPDRLRGGAEAEPGARRRASAVNA